VSSFRFRDGAYLILEYASGGDLHSLLKRSGSLDIEATRFISGELVSALYYIHQQSLVYADLKPENILLTKCGHVKLTDFGACRPCTLEARQSLKRHGRDLFQRLRDGDWKAASHGIKMVGDETFSNTTESDSDDDYIQNLRIEGTTAYLPPEVILGALPNQATDSWALGCVAYYCSKGRPPMLEDDEAATKQKIVTFDLSTIHDESSAINDSIKAFISKLLRKDPIERLTMEDALKDDFFNAIDVLNLHKSLAPPLTVGLFAPKIDARWNRRQFSSIWAPQPREYHVSNSLSRTTDHQHEEIVELDESGSTFTSLHAI
jgi:serine/threonine protein kinase